MPFCIVVGVFDEGHQPTSIASKNRLDAFANLVKEVTRYSFDPEIRWEAAREISEGLHDTEHGELTYHAEVGRRCKDECTCRRRLR